MFLCGPASIISTSTRWFSPGPTFAVTMTSAPGCAAFQMHFGGGNRKAGSSNLIARVSVDCKSKNRVSKGREEDIRRCREW